MCWNSLSQHYLNENLFRFDEKDRKRPRTTDSETGDQETMDTDDQDRSQAAAQPPTTDPTPVRFQFSLISYFPLEINEKLCFWFYHKMFSSLVTSRLSLRIAYWRRLCAYSGCLSACWGRLCACIGTGHWGAKLHTIKPLGWLDVWGKGVCHRALFTSYQLIEISGH